MQVRQSGVALCQFDKTEVILLHYLIFKSLRLALLFSQVIDFRAIGVEQIAKVMKGGDMEKKAKKKQVRHVSLFNQMRAAVEGYERRAGVRVEQVIFNRASRHEDNKITSICLKTAYMSVTV